MASNMVNPHNELIKEFFQKELPSFTLLSENAHSMFWEIKFANDKIEIKISGDAGGFVVSVFIEKTEFPLWQYDRKVIELSETKDENILSQLLILGRFIKELSLDSPN